MHWLWCLFWFCYISVLHKQEIWKVDPMRLLIFLPGAAPAKSAQVSQPIISSISAQVSPGQPLSQAQVSPSQPSVSPQSTPVSPSLP